MSDIFTDSRALQDKDFNKFYEGELAPFVELVKKHEELELCFRGNYSPPSVCIYYNNHVIFRVGANGETEISFHHARYSKYWKKYFDELTKAGFHGTIKNKKLEGMRRYKEIEVSKFKANKVITLEELEKLYKGILLPMFKDYFDAAGRKDVPDYFKFFKENNNEINGYKVKFVPGKLEKIRQQALFTRMVFNKDGYFFYDMEFAQKHKNKTDRDNDKANNQPDMLAIKFDHDKKPEKIVLVEVKCTKSSMSNKSGIEEHLKDMKSYIDIKNNIYGDYRKARKKEACQILNEYAKLGLRRLAPTNIFCEKDFEKAEFQILLVLTDDAITEWNKEKYNSIKATYNLEQEKNDTIANLNFGFKAELWKTKC